MRFLYQNAMRTIVFAAIYLVGIRSAAAQTLLDIVDSRPELSELSSLVELANLESLLSSPGQFTLLAFTNDAYNALPAETQAFIDNPEIVKTALSYHAIAGTQLSTTFKAGSVPTLAGEPVTVSVSGSAVQVNDANVISKDIVASNGVIHVIDKVLLPPNLKIPVSGDPILGPISGGEKSTMQLGTEPGTLLDVIKSKTEFSILSTLVDSAGLGDTLSGPERFTLFAPTNDALSMMPSDLTNSEVMSFLEHHMISGITTSLFFDTKKIPTLGGQDVEMSVNEGFWNEADTVMVNGATVITTDIYANNGVIHMIDAVLVGSTSSSVQGTTSSVAEQQKETSSAAEQPKDTASSEGAGMSNLVGVLASNSELSTLSSLVESAGLKPLLSRPEPFTLLAFTNDAFDALPEQEQSALIAPQNSDVLTMALAYHAIDGIATSNNLAPGSVPTLAGQSVKVSVDEDNVVMVNDAHVISTDIMASNGVVHVIDKVLTPPKSSLRKKYLR